MLYRYAATCFTCVCYRDSPTNIELLEPVEGSVPGDHVFVEGYSNNEEKNVPDLLNPKKKVWDKLQVSDLADTLLFRTSRELCDRQVTL